MTVQFKPSVRANAKVLLGIAGPSGSGKTLSALRIARGLAGGKDKSIFFIDTENGRGLHYACAEGEKPTPYQFAFNHASMTPPFSPAAYVEAIKAAEQAKATVIIVDSQSHEHEGEGGILEMQEAELKRMAGDDWQKREKVKFTAWIKPKSEHNKFVNAVLRVNAHMIFCFRAKDKMMMVKNDRGKMEPVSIGWEPICSSRFEYEQTAMLILPPKAEGIPDLTAKACKLQEVHRPIFVAGTQLDESVGEKLAEWGRGKDAKLNAPSTNTESIAGYSKNPPKEPTFEIKSARKTTTFGSAAEWETNWLTAIAKATPAKVKQGAELNAEIFENLVESGYLDEVEAVQTAIKAKIATDAEKSPDSAID